MEKTPEKNTSEVKKTEDKKAEVTTSASKKTGLIIGIVAGVVALALIIGVIVLCTRGGDDADKDKNDDSSQVEDKKDEEVKTKVVGNDEFGYFTMPEDWVEVDSEEGSIQWGSKNGKYTIGVITADSSEISASDWAEGTKMVLEQQSGIEDVKVTEKDFAGLGKAQVVSGNYKSYGQWMEAYIIDTKDGKVRYIAVEGPNKDNEAFKIVDTYKLKK